MKNKRNRKMKIVENLLPHNVCFTTRFFTFKLKFLGDQCNTSKYSDANYTGQQRIFSYSLLRKPFFKLNLKLVSK